MIRRTEKEKLILLFQEYIALDNAISVFMDHRKKKLKTELMHRLESIKYQINALMQSEYPNLPNDFDVPTLQKYLQDLDTKRKTLSPKHLPWCFT